MQAQKKCDTFLLKGKKNYGVFFLQRLEHTLTLAYHHRRTYCAAHMLAIVREHIQYLDTLCPDKSIILSYYAASCAGEDCVSHPSSALYFLLKISRQINKSELYTDLNIWRGSASSGRQFRTFSGDLKSRWL